MVLAEIGHAAGADPVLRNAHAVDIEPADDGRDAAPGAKLDPVMPGLANRRSPSVAEGVRRSSSFGTTVTVAN